MDFQTSFHLRTSQSSMTLVYKFVLVALCVALAMRTVGAIYEEQLGEFDWKRENIGTIDRSFTVQSSLIVATSKNMLASLDTESGMTKWRTLLPSGTNVVNFVEVDGNVVTLSVQQQPSTSEDLPVYTVLVRCWSILDGSMQWDTFLGSYTSAEIDVYSHSELMYVTTKRLLTVLSGKSLHFVTVPARMSANALQYWSWSASSDVSVAQEGKVLQLSTLVAPTYMEGEDRGAGTQDYVRLAVGCFTHTQSPSSYCDGNLAVVKVHLPSAGAAAGEVSLEEVPGFPASLQARPREVAAAVSSQASLPYQANDVIFVSKSTAGAQVSMTVVSLVDGSLRTVQSAPGAGADANDEAAPAIAPATSFVLVTADGELRPAATACAGDVCRSFSLVAPSWALEPVSEGGVCTGTGGQSAVLHSAFPFYERIVQSVHCLGFAASATHLRSIAVDRVALDLTSSNVLLPPFFSAPTAQQGVVWSGAGAGAAPVHHVQLLPWGRVSQSGSRGLRLLVVLHSGVTMLLQSNSGSVVAWSRNEALASVQQALVIDSLHSDAVSATGAAADADGTLPSFVQRLALQGAKIQNHALNAVATAKKLVATTVNTAQRLSQSGLGAQKGRAKEPVKPRDVGKLRAFGFDKLAVLLCYSDRLASMLEAAEGRGIPFSEAGLQLVFVDLLRSAAAADEEVQGVRFLGMREGEGEQDPLITSVKLVVGAAPTRRVESQQVVGQPGAGAADEPVEGASAAGKTVTIIVGTASGRTLFWDVDPTSCVSAGAPNTCSGPSAAALEPWTAAVSGPPGTVGAGAVASVAAAFTTVHIKDRSVKVPAYTILHSPEDGSDVTAVTLMLRAPHSDRASHQDPIYVHYVDRSTGKITVFKTSTLEADRQQVCGNRKMSLSPGASLRLQCVAVRSAGSVALHPSEERIVDVTYPSAADPVHVHYSILGDDSVLLKYLNPHVVLVTSVSTAASSSPGPAAAAAAVASASAADGGDAAGSAEEEGPSSVMYWTLIDTVTGRIIVRLQQESASLPAHSVIIENHIVSTYWNSKAKRTELSSTALYEGVIDSTELTPFASSRQRANSAYLSSSSSAVKSRSAFTSVSPIAMQKTYTLPRAVSALHHTVTAHGMSNKNLLLALRNGQVYSVDMKQIHPRRPFSDPSPAEKTEGLVRYSPFLTLVPLGALTHNYSLPGGAAHIVSAPSNLESSSLALSFGGATADLHLNRVMPSQDFDLLSSDFNYSLLVAILMALATAVRMLRNMQQRKHLSTIWA